MVGLATTIIVMNVFEAAQPALLYIVPAVLAAVLGHAAINKQFNEVSGPTYLKCASGQHRMCSTVLCNISHCYIAQMPYWKVSPAVLGHAAIDKQLLQVSEANFTGTCACTHTHRIHRTARCH